MRAAIFAALLVVSITFVVVGLILTWCYQHRLAELVTEPVYDHDEFVLAMNKYASGIMLAILGAIGAFAWMWLA